MRFGEDEVQNEGRLFRWTVTNDKNSLHVTHYDVHVFEASLNIIYKNI